MNKNYEIIKKLHYNRKKPREKKKLIYYAKARNQMKENKKLGFENYESDIKKSSNLNRENKTEEKLKSRDEMVEDFQKNSDSESKPIFNPNEYLKNQSKRSGLKFDGIFFLIRAN